VTDIWRVNLGLIIIIIIIAAAEQVGLEPVLAGTADACGVK